MIASTMYFLFQYLLDLFSPMRAGANRVYKCLEEGQTVPNVNESGHGKMKVTLTPRHITST